MPPVRWQRKKRSDNIEDRRGRVGTKLGLGGTIVVLILAAIFGRDFLARLGDSGSSKQSSEDPLPRDKDKDADLVDFISFALDDMQNVWGSEFKKLGKQYQPAKLVLFTRSVRSACGFQSAATGPFYCPGDNKAYIDLSFYRALEDRFGAPGDFAQAYVLAHEIGHHVQNLLGFSARMRREQRNNPRKKNELSIRLELQADCFAGLWGHSTQKRNLLEQGDVDEGLEAAAAIGDDRLQKQATGHVTPESWTHGSSEQRKRWFRRGFDAGTIDACDTFSAVRL